MSWNLHVNTIQAKISGYRDYPLQVVEGELYEVWLKHDWEEPKPCVTVSSVAVGLEDGWKVLVDGTIHEVLETRIFKTGTATRPDPPFGFPHIKNLPSSVFAMSTVEVQPMKAPAGSLFYMDYTYSEKKYDANEDDE